MVIAVPVGGFLPHYAKKEDAENIAKSQRKGFGFIIMGMGIVLAIMQFLVLPRLHDMYVEFGYHMPFLVKNAPLFSTIFTLTYIGLGLYFLITEPDYEKVRSVTSKYKKGEMIKTKEIINSNAGMWIVVGLVLGTLYMFGSMIYPIYQLTSNVQLCLYKPLIIYFS